MRRRGGPGLPVYASNMMFELVQALGGYALANPGTQGKELIRVSCGCEFEGFGRASESWDLVWTLTLVQVRHHWRATDGWRIGTNQTPMTFKGHDDAEVLKAALQFLRDVPRPAMIGETGMLDANALDDAADIGSAR